jgi:hypothetical protein
LRLDVPSGEVGCPPPSGWLREPIRLGAWKYRAESRASDLAAAPRPAGEVMPPTWPFGDANPPPGVNEVGPRDWMAELKPPEPVTYPLDLDLGEMADGYHLIVTSIALTDEALLFDFKFEPEVPDEERAKLYPNMNYGADVSPPGWNQWASDADVYQRPVPEASYAWFDFFRPYYDWLVHLGPHGQPDDDYVRNRVLRLTFDMKTGEAQIEK